MSNEPHRLNHDEILAYCQTHPNWDKLPEAGRYHLIAEAAKESMLWWFHDQTEAAYNLGYDRGRDESRLLGD